LVQGRNQAVDAEMQNMVSQVIQCPRERPTYIQAQLDKARSKQTTAFAGIVTHEESRKLGAMVVEILQNKDKLVLHFDLRRLNFWLSLDRRFTVAEAKQIERVYAQVTLPYVSGRKMRSLQAREGDRD
jgi:hypothetical protein